VERGQCAGATGWGHLSTELGMLGRRRAGQTQQRWVKLHMAQPREMREACCTSCRVCHAALDFPADLGPFCQHSMPSTPEGKDTEAIAAHHTEPSHRQSLG
jgi:hypothetical protein